MQLAELVDDLLDLAKVEAGKIEVSPSVFEVRDLFSALRGMLRPLLINEALALVFEEPDHLPPICSDERKVSQILRNLISNALKYTERGEVRVTARMAAAGGAIEFAVSDTGIGIPDTALSRIFDEFVQVENPLQRRVKGTGLGLPLSKRLAELLGGSITVNSTLGLGSTFCVTLPLMPPDFETAGLLTDPLRKPVLVVDDDEADLLMFERALTGTRFQVIPARSAAAATKTLDLLRPAAIVLDIRLHGEESWDLIARLKNQRSTSDIPLLVVSSIDDPQKALALGVDAYCHKPLDATWLQQTLEQVVQRPDAVRLLIVDDQEPSRFIVREMLRGRDHEIVEAGSGRDGLRQAQQLLPSVVLLDLQLGDMDGLDLRDALQRDPRTSQAAIVIITSRTLTDSERERLGPETPVLSKADLTRECLYDAMQRAVERATGRLHNQPDVLEAS